MIKVITVGVIIVLVVVCVIVIIMIMMSNVAMMVNSAESESDYMNSAIRRRAIPSASLRVSHK